jgi:hypothetical protein
VELRRAGFAARLAEKNIVIGVRIERWIEIDEVHALVRELVAVAEPPQIIAEIKAIHLLGSRGLRWHDGSYRAVRHRVNDPLRRQELLEEISLNRRLRLVIQYLREETGSAAA